MNNFSQLNNERPLVTFALFAFNQEQYIREAIEGAFSQTYEPLEIILSDDCSSDLTFEIMQEMAAAYQGPHQVIVRQSDVNRGTFNHILDVAQQSHGEYIVAAAGDDISLPERTSAVIPHFKDKEVLALSSDEIVIDENGKIQENDKSRFKQRDIWYRKNNSWLFGATEVFRSNFLKAIPLSTNKIMLEDMMFPLLIKARGGKSLRLKIPLIKYRHHSSNISIGKLKTNDLEYLESRFIRQVNYYKDVFLYFNKVVKDYPNIYIYGEQILNDKKNTIEYLKLISNWTHLSFISKIKLLFIAIKVNETKTAVPRLFGRKFFFFIKNIVRG